MEAQKVILENGTVLEVGKKYRREMWHELAYIKITQIFKEEKKALGLAKYACNDLLELELLDLDENDIIPCIERVPKEDFKTFLIEVENLKKKVIYQFPIFTDSMESAKKLHPKAISIIEVNKKKLI